MEPGRKGDFFTSVSVGGFFGQLLAAQFAIWLNELPGEKAQILETGAHNGKLAADILSSLNETHPALFARLEYVILEPSEIRAAVQKKTLHPFERTVRRLKSWDDLGTDGVRGVIFSNELLDAMPVHRLAWDKKQRVWFERGIEIVGDGYGWIRMPVIECPRPLFDLPEKLLDILPNGFTAELCPAATDWWKTAAKHLTAGKLLALDYGLTEEEFFMPQRKDGTVRAYFKHKLSSDLLANVGEQDLTAHVNFSRIISAGESAGLKTEKFCSQSSFLTGAFQEMLGSNPDSAKLRPAQVRQFQTLTHPEHMGHSFRALVQSRT